MYNMYVQFQSTADLRSCLKNVRQSNLGLQFMHIFMDRSKDCSVTKKQLKIVLKNLIGTVSDPVHIEIEIPPDLLL
jgi:hypothetical protein